MIWLFSRFATLSTFLLCAVASAQSPSIGVSPDVAPSSIIVKFRSVAAMSDSALLQRVRSVGDVTRPVFQSHSTNPGDSPQRADTFGLSRIVQIPLREGVTAQDAVRALAAGNLFEYVEPNFRYRLDRSIIPNDSLFDRQW